MLTPFEEGEGDPELNPAEEEVWAPELDPVVEAKGDPIDEEVGESEPNPVDPCVPDISVADVVPDAVVLIPVVGGNVGAVTGALVVIGGAVLNPKFSDKF